MRRSVLGMVSFLLFSLVRGYAQIQERFPKPDFQSDYVRPDLITPASRSAFLEYLDVFVLLVAISLASYFALKSRSRRKIFILMLACLAYFGFYRKGCVCSVGAVQNVAYALSNSGYAVPLTVIAFFVLPLGFALFFGRTFCAAVCPLGAAQDAVVLKPVRVTPWLDQILGIFPYVYLGLAVLFAATGAGFVICQFDPFVGFFRFGASFNMVLLGASLLLLGTVVARPYCRFLCPYGVLLNWMSRLSKRHVRITPSECINCRLCEESCPFGSIKKPTEALPAAAREKDIKRMALLFVLLPVIVVGSGWVGSRLHTTLSRKHFTVYLAEEIIAENAGERSVMSDHSTAFRASGKPTVELFAEARSVQKLFKIGSWILGGFLGLILSLKLIGLSTPGKQPEYGIDRGSCLSCARCFSYCPYEQVRLGIITPAELKAIEAETESISKEP